MVRFSGFELDRQRAELRGPDGGAIRLRPKTFDILLRFVADPGRIFSKQELMETVWPNVHVGEGSLFQCIREIRAALGDDRRQIVKLVSGRGYLFEPRCRRRRSARPRKFRPPRLLWHRPPCQQKSWRPFGLSAPTALAAVAVLGAALGLAIAAPMFGRDLFKQRPPAIAVMPITGVDAGAAPTAAVVTVRLGRRAGEDREYSRGDARSGRRVAAGGVRTARSASGLYRERRIAEDRSVMGTARPPHPRRDPGGDQVGAGFSSRSARAI